MSENNNKIALVCSNYAWTIMNFRMPLIRRLKSEGYNVVVLTQFDGYESLISKEVAEVRKLFISRRGINPFIDILTVLDLLKHLIIIKPNIFLPFTIKPVIYGCAVAKLINIKSIVMITGLGTVFIQNTWVKHIVMALYRFALSSVRVVFFQNNDDKSLFIDHGLVSRDICYLIPGSGVDLDKFKFTKLPSSKELKFLLIGRMLWDKGVGEFVDAASQLNSRYKNISFQLLGPIGVQNRSAIPYSKIKEWQDDKIIEYLGETDNVAAFIADSSCVVLPSYREGTSKVLLEAAAMGRPIIASDVPGCREVVEDGNTGFLCRSNDASDLSKKIEMMISLPYATRSEMGRKGREKIKAEYRQEIVCDKYIEAIKNKI